MKWIKDILAKHTNDAGVLDLEAAESELNTEAPKNVIPKEVYNSKVDDLKKANELVDDLKKSNNSNEDLKKQIDDYKTKLADSEVQRTNDRKHAAVELALTKYGALNNKATKALIDLEKVEVSDDGIKGLDDQLTSVKEENPYLFKEAAASEEKTTKPRFGQTGNPGVGTNESKPAANKDLNAHRIIKK
ncbi:MAG: phage scaffolding protein [Alkalibacterium sp.]|nr:phage scaffolding protein [Alkalibacterium sp.]